MDLTPSDALLRDAAGERRVGVDTITVGAVIVVRPGEKIPLDGDVVAGQSEVNQAPVTGESLPVERGVGDDVFAGTINGRGALDVRVTRLRRDTTLARIIHLVERAQSQRAPAQTLVERFASVYTPAVLALAAAVAVLPPLVLHQGWQIWVYRALVLLVVSCPCALVISTPVSIVAALAGAARKGVLIKGGAHLERLSRVRCVAFDKTGTLTRGTPAVVKTVTLNGAGSESIVGLAASVEHRSTHPIAQAILEHASAAGIASAPADAVSALAGRGAEGQVAGRSRAGRESSPVRGAAALLAGDARSRDRDGRRRTYRGPGCAQRATHRHHRRGRPAARQQPRGRRTAPRAGRAGHRHADRRQRRHGEGDRRGARRRRLPRGAAAGRQGGGVEELRRTLRIGRDGRRRRQRRAGAGVSRRRDRDGRGRQRRRARNRRCRADGRRAAADSLHVPPEPRDRAQHQDQPGDLAWC